MVNCLQESRYKAHQRRWASLTIEQRKLKSQKLYASKVSDPERYQKHLEFHKKYRKEMRDIARELGNCTICFGFNPEKEFKTCPKCRTKLKASYQRRKKKLNKEKEDGN